MKSKNEIEIYEVDGFEKDIKNEVFLEVESHWNRNAFVVLKIDGKSYTVVADELKRAIENSTNTK